MATCYHGKNGALSLGGTNIAMLTSWTLTENADTVECTAMGDTSRKYMVGIKGFEGSAECVWTDETATQSISEITVGTTYNAIFFVDDNATATADMGYKGDVIVTSIEVAAAMDDVVRATVNFQGTGDLSRDDSTTATEESVTG